MIKRFSVIGDVQDVGLRMQLINMGITYNLKVYPTNLPNNLVEVIVEGDEKDILAFYERAKNDVRINKQGDKYSLTSLDDYNEVVPDWTFVTIQFILEQLMKGAFEYFRIKKSLETLVKNMNKKSTKSKKKSKRRSR